MTIAEIKINARVFDRALQRTGMVVAIHKHSNPDLPSDVVTVKVAPGALVWSKIIDLERAA
jgi:hypothetical protein